MFVCLFFFFVKFTFLCKNIRSFKHCSIVIIFSVDIQRTRYFSMDHLVLAKPYWPKKPLKWFVLFNRSYSKINETEKLDEKIEFVSMSAADVLSPYLGVTEQNIVTHFQSALEKAPSILFIDEIDSLGRQRSASEDDVSRRIKNTFLLQLDSLVAILSLLPFSF